MASEEKSKEKLGPPDLPMASFQWGAVLSAVKDQIPSMESDTSTSDGDEDEDPCIFQRELSNLIPDFSEELEDYPMDQTDSQGEENVLRFELRGRTVLDRDVPGIQEPSREQGTTSLELTRVEHQPEDSSIFREKEPVAKKGEEAWASTADKLPWAKGLPFVCEKEQSGMNCSEDGRELTGAKSFTKMTLGHPQKNNNNSKLERVAKGESEQRVISAEHPQEFTLFAFKDIEKWDLDKVLQDVEIQSNTRRSQAAEATFLSMDHETYRTMSQTKLMGKLEELCLKQSRAFSVHQRRQLAKFPHFNGCQGDRRHVPTRAPLTNVDSWTRLESQYKPDPPTVYIDLRNAEAQKCDLPADETQSSSDSSADSEEDAEVMNRAEEGMEEFSQQAGKDCTGKSFLLQQLRNFRQRPSQTPAKDSKTITQDEGREQDRKTVEETSLPQDRKKWCLKRQGRTSLGPVFSGSVARHVPSFSHLKSTISCSRELEKEIVEGPHLAVLQAALEDKDTNFPRAGENRKEKQVQENQRRQRLQHQPERSKLQLCLPGKQHTAEQTPVLFHTSPGDLPSTMS